MVLATAAAPNIHTRRPGLAPITQSSDLSGAGFYAGRDLG